jgi:hypothetical protein
MKKVFFLVAVLFSVGSLFAQNTPNNPRAVQQKPFDLAEQGVRIEPDKRLMLVMAALEYGGLQTTLTESGREFRKKLNADLPADEDLQGKIKAFFNSYKSRQDATKTTAELLAPYVSLAYALTPDLTEPARTTDLPADLLEVLDFAVLVREFNRKTGFDSKMPEYFKQYQAEGDKMRLSAGQMVYDLLTYLNSRPQTTILERVKVDVPDPKNPKKQVLGTKLVERERRFFIVPDLLASAGTVNFRNIGDDYYVVVPPNTNFLVSEARRAYLQYILDPLFLKSAKEVSPHKDKIKELLEERRKTNPDISPDVFLAVLRSLVAAADAKAVEFQRVQLATDTARREIDFAKTPEAKKAVSDKLNKDKKDFADETAAELAEAYERGAVLSFYFAEQLRGLENSGFSIDGSLSNMIMSIDTTKEKDRLLQAAEARKRIFTIREERRKNTAALVAKNEQSIVRARELKSRLEPVEELLKNKSFVEAETRLKTLLDEFPGEASIYYALGRTASLSAASLESGGTGTFDESLRDKRLDDAKLFYSNAIKSATPETDPVLIQLSYFALGRIFEFYEDTNYAIQIYQTAMKYGNLKGGAYNESAAAIARLSAPKQP